MEEEKELAILMHSYKRKKKNESEDDIKNELLTLLDKNGFEAQIYNTETRKIYK